MVHLLAAEFVQFLEIAECQEPTTSTSMELWSSTQFGTNQIASLTVLCPALNVKRACIIKP